MKFNIEIEIDDMYIEEYMADNNATRSETCNEIGNVCYLGISCIDAMLDRQLGMPMNSDGFVQATEKER